MTNYWDQFTVNTTKVSTRLQEVSLLFRLMAGCVLALLLIGAGWVCLLTLPPFLVAFLIIPSIPFLFLGYRASGRCPHCRSHIEVRTKRGGTHCRKCYGSIAIENKMMHPL